MIENPYLYQFAFFGLNFLLIMVELILYSIFAWVVATWLIIFGIIQPSNRVFGFLTQLVMPIIKPFRWARIGMVDLSPLVALFLLLYLVMPVLQAGLGQLVG